MNANTSENGAANDGAAASENGAAMNTVAVDRGAGVRETVIEGVVGMVGETTTRVGKIARLPRAIRTELNGRLLDGMPAVEVLAWLNAKGEVKEVLKKYFNAREVSPQNLSEWKAGGYRDWCRHQEAMDRASLMLEEAEDFEAAAGRTGKPWNGDRFVEMLVAMLAQELQAARLMPAGLERTRVILQISREFNRLRMSDRRAEQATREQENYIRQVYDENQRRKETAIEEQRKREDDRNFTYMKEREKAMEARKAGQPVPEAVKAFLTGETAHKQMAEKYRKFLAVMPSVQFDPVMRKLDTPENQVKRERFEARAVLGDYSWMETAGGASGAAAGGGEFKGKV